MHHKDKMVHLFWFTWIQTSMMSKEMPLCNTEIWILQPANRHTIRYFYWDTFDPPSDCAWACLLGGGRHPLILHSYWLILHHELRMEQFLKKGIKREKLTYLLLHKCQNYNLFNWLFCLSSKLLFHCIMHWNKRSDDGALPFTTF